MGFFRIRLFRGVALVRFFSLHFPVNFTYENFVFPIKAFVTKISIPGCGNLCMGCHWNLLVGFICGLLKPFNAIWPGWVANLNTGFRSTCSALGASHEKYRYCKDNFFVDFSRLMKSISYMIITC